LVDKDKQKSIDKDTKKFYPSSIGKCSREITYKMLGYPEEDIDPRVLMVFENGHSFHERMENLFKEVGILVAPELPIRDPNLRISGRTDAVIYNPHPDKDKQPKDLVTLKGFEGEVIYNGPNNEIALVELKSINNKGFNRVVSKGAKIDHKWQLMLYMYLSGIRQGLLYYENKDTQETYEVWVEYDQKVVDKLLNKIITVNQHVDNNTLPPREHSRSSPVCGWCSYSNMCWGSVKQSWQSIEELI
jgi:CRISPR/Cas system-associated exonuclease Cas4 (RecB family)